MQVYQETAQSTTQQDETPVPFIGARGFTQVENAMIYDCRLSAEARFTYTVLASHMFNKDHCWPGMKRLAYIVGKTEKTVRGYLRELEDAGYIHKNVRGQGYTNVYTRKAASLNYEFRPVNTTDQEQNIFTGLEQALITAKEDKVEEEKYKNPPGGAAALQKGESKEKGKVPDPSKTSTPSPKSENQQHKAARELAEQLGASVDLDEEEREKYRINFKRLIEDGVDAHTLEAVRVRIVERWSSGYQLSPKKALGDVRGETGKGKASPPEVIEAIRNHKYFGESGTMSRSKMWEIAERWDFTSYEEPPMDVRKRISRDRRECNEWITRLNSIASRAMKEKEEVGRRRAMEMDPEHPAAPARMDSPALEEAPKGSTTPKAAEGDELGEEVIRMAADPESKTARLARAVIAGKRSPRGPITKEDVEAAAVDEIDLETVGGTEKTRPLTAKILAMLLIKRLREQANEKASA